MEKFSLQHTVLYSKGWYKKSKDIWKDLSKCLEADGYVGTFIGDSPEKLKNRLTYLLVSQFQRLPNKGYVNSLAAFYEEIKPYNCWKYGYYTKDYKFLRNSQEINDSPDYDYNEAVARYCLSNFSMLSRDEWNTCSPDYKLVLPRKNGIKDKTIKEHFSSLSLLSK